MLKVLVVEDDKNINEFVTRVLKSKLGCRAVSALNGIDAISLLNHEPFDLVLLDIAMPLINGVEILEIIRSDEELKKLPVVMLTANKEKEVVARLVKLGIMGFISKPLTIESTYKKLSEILNNTGTYERPDANINRDNSKVVIADQNDDIRKALTGRLSSDYEIIEAESGLEALKQFMKHRPKRMIFGKNLALINEKLLAKTIRKIEKEKTSLIYILSEQNKLTEEERAYITEAIEIPENLMKLPEAAEKIIKKID